MVLLDTNVLSELMRPSPESKVISWLDAKPEEEIWISAITVAEIHLRIESLPEGRRKALLSDLAEEMFQEEFFERCLPFDYQEAGVYAAIVAKPNRQGRPVSMEDAQIAAIAITANLELTTRNIKDFSDIQDLKIVNPWD